MDVTSVTSPIGLWTAAWKPIVSDLTSAILKILVHFGGSLNRDFPYLGMALTERDELRAGLWGCVTLCS